MRSRDSGSAHFQSSSPPCHQLAAAHCSASCGGCLVLRIWSDRAPAGRTAFASGCVLLKQGLTAQQHATMLRTRRAYLTIERCKMYITDMAQDKAKGTSTEEMQQTHGTCHMTSKFPLLHGAATSLWLEL